MKKVLIVKTNMKSEYFARKVLAKAKNFAFDKTRIITGQEIKLEVDMNDRSAFDKFVKKEFKKLNNLIFLCESTNFVFKVSKSLEDIKFSGDVLILSKDIISNVVHNQESYSLLSEAVLNSLLNCEKSIKDIRKSLHLSLEDMSFLSGLTIAHIQKIENSCECQNRDGMNYVKLITHLSNEFNKFDRITLLHNYIYSFKNYELIGLRLLVGCTSYDIENLTNVSDATITMLERNKNNYSPIGDVLKKFYINKLANTKDAIVNAKCIKMLIRAYKALYLELPELEANMSISSFLNHITELMKQDNSFETLAARSGLSSIKLHPTDNELVEVEEATEEIVEEAVEELEESFNFSQHIEQFNLIESLKSGKAVTNSELAREHSYLIMQNNKIIKYTIKSEVVDNLSMADLLRSDWRLK